MVAGAARKVIHVEMDAFFASVEQRYDPSVRGLTTHDGLLAPALELVCAILPPEKGISLVGGTVSNFSQPPAAPVELPIFAEGVAA